MRNVTVQSICVFYMSVYICMQATTAHAAMSSANFSLETKSIGNASAPMSSANYSVVPSNGTPYTDGTNVSSDNEGNTTQYGSTKKDTLGSVPTKETIISADKTEQQDHATNTSVDMAQGQKNSSEGKAMEPTEEVRSEDQNGNGELHTDTQPKHTFLENIKTLFKERKARAIVLFSTVSILWYVRTFTRIGKLYRPF